MKFNFPRVLGNLTMLCAFTLMTDQGIAAEKMTSKEATRRIAAAVKGMSPLAASGVEEFLIETRKTVQEVMLALAFKTKYITVKSEFNWIEEFDGAWGADSMEWGQTSMKGAYSYIMELDDQERDYLREPANKKKLKKYESNLAKAKVAFKNLLGTGVMFGIAPMGAIQCGVTFASLAIIDPHSGTISIFSKEGSGC